MLVFVPSLYSVGMWDQYFGAYKKLSMSPHTRYVPMKKTRYIIIPNHPTVHPNALLTPNASTHPYCPCAASRSNPSVEGGAGSSSRAQGVIFFLSEAGVQVVGCGGGGRERFFRGRGARLALSLRDFSLPSVSDGGRGDWRAPDRPCSCPKVYSLMFIYTLPTHLTCQEH